MKSYRNALAALVLAFVFSTSAFAGDGIMYTGITSPPPPPQTTGIMYTGRTTPQADGVISTGEAAPAPEADTLTEIGLNLLQSVLSLI
jgi:hypothetical protein